MSDITRYVDTDVVGGAGDGTSWSDAYSSLNAAEAAEQADLTDGGGDTLTFLCRANSGSADTVAVTFSGWTTNSTCFIKIECDDFNNLGVFNTTDYRLYTHSNIYTISLLEDDFKSNNFQIETNITQSGAGFAVWGQGAGAYLEFSNTIIRGTGSAPLSGNGFLFNDSDIYADVYNCIVYGFSNGTDEDLRGVTVGAATIVNIYNSIFFDTTFGIAKGAHQTVTVKNCAVGNCVDDFKDFGGGTFTIDYCCSDDGDGTNAQNPSGGDWTNEFVDPDGGNFTPKFGGNCIENGTNDPGSGLYDNDIIGTTRS